MNCAVHTETPAAAYCRTCGKALCDNCKRDVMGAIYCESCIAARVQGSQTAIPAAAPAAPPAAPGAPNPGIAAFLGFIPGVGAMYNGQFMKGFIHVLIFVMLILGADQVHWIFGLMIGFFVFYMVFDAYKTAQARLLGIPAPDPLGLERIFGLQDNPHVPTAVASGPQITPSSGSAPSAPAMPATNQPVGAIILIALGVLFLLSNTIHLRWEHIFPVMLIGLGLWLAYKRMIART